MLNAAAIIGWPRSLTKNAPQGGRWREGHRCLEALSETLRDENPTPDLTDVDQAIARLRIAIDEGAGNPVSSHNTVVLPFVVDTLRRDLGDLTDALARPATT